MKAIRLGSMLKHISQKQWMTSSVDPKFLVVVGNSTGRHGVSRGCDFVCEVARGLFQFGVARRGRREYSLHAKALPCPIFCSGGEERACGTIHVRIILSASPGFYLLSCFYLLFLFLLLLLSSFSCRLRGPQFRVQTPFLSRGNNILHIFILHAKVTEMGVTPSSQN